MKKINKKQSKKITDMSKQQISEAVKDVIDEIFESKEMKEFYEEFRREALRNIEKAKNTSRSKKKNIKTEDMVLFKWNGIHNPEPKECHRYLMEGSQDLGGSKKYNELYRDLMEWFWQNSDYAYDRTDENPPYELNDKTKKLLFRPMGSDAYPYNIISFGTNKEGAEYSDYDFGPAVFMSNNRIKKLRTWLKKRGWSEYVLVSPDECPCFIRSIDEKGIDRIIILGSLLIWNSYSNKEKEALINKFEKNGFTYHEKAGGVLVNKWRIRDSIYRNDFKSIKFPIEEIELLK